MQTAAEQGKQSWISTFFLPVLTQIEMGGKQDQHGHKTEKEVDYIQTEDENGNTTIYFGMIPLRF